MFKLKISYVLGKRKPVFFFEILKLVNFFPQWKDLISISFWTELLYCGAPLLHNDWYHLAQRCGVKKSLGRQQTSFYSRPLKNTGTSVSSQKENKERWGIILNHLIVNKPPDVSSKPTEKRGLHLTHNKAKGISGKMISISFIWHPGVWNMPTGWVTMAQGKSWPHVGRGRKWVIRPYPLACPSTNRP